MSDETKRAMSEPKHSPEPWRVGEYPDEAADANGVFCAEGCGGSAFASILDIDEAAYVASCAANARRIVACVNACAGIPTEALEGGNLEAALDALAESLRHCRTGLVSRGDRVEAALRALGRLP